MTILLVIGLCTDGCMAEQELQAESRGAAE